MSQPDRIKPIVATAEITQFIVSQTGISESRVSDSLARVIPQLYAPMAQEDRLIAQMYETAVINKQADMFENHIIEQGLTLPRFFLNFTAGFDAPKNATSLGLFQDEVFPSFVLPDILGHTGKISMSVLESEESKVM